ncbi:MAG TPA: hypothetical protein VMT10_05920 [Solirubrobacteraceae bacterium]|nr:hypothetical protein [Solirubrobacteraceae bacterium]
MCANCKDPRGCDCTGGSRLAACSCASGQDCPVCNHTPDVTAATEPEFLIEVVDTDVAVAPD